MNKFSLMTALGGLVMSAALNAAEPTTPTTAPGVEVVTIDQAKALVGKAQFFDMRSAVNFGKGHIKGAVALPYDNKSENAPTFDASKDKFDAAKLPGDKAATIVFYSDGPTGWKSYKAAIQAAKSGYKNVKWMREGTTGWTAKALPLE
jgi:rhodanese-related sulfurtransferase